MGQRLAYTSLNGAHNKGPTPKPNSKKLNPSNDTSVPTWNCEETWSMAGEYTEEAHVLPIVVKLHTSAQIIQF